VQRLRSQLGLHLRQAPVRTSEQVCRFSLSHNRVQHASEMVLTQMSISINEQMDKRGKSVLTGFMQTHIVLTQNRC